MHIITNVIYKLVKWPNVGARMVECRGKNGRMSGQELPNVGARMAECLGRFKQLNNSGCQTMWLIASKFNTPIHHIY